MTLTEAQTQFNALADRLSAAKAAQKAALASLGRTPTDVWDTYPDELRAVTGGTGNYQESKTVTADPAGMTILPDEGYSGMLKAIIAAEPNFQPWNIVDGIEAWGITGTAKPAVSTAPPTNLPVDKDDADTAYEDATGAAPTEADYFILADNDGNITYGYMQSASTALYNGVELPDINAVWTNKETYPYAYMYYFSSSDLRLLLTNKAIISVDASTNVGIRFPASTTYLIYKSAPVGSAWSYVNKVTTSSSNLTAAVNTDDFLWCNESIVSTDGVVVFAASDPIPVGGGFTITYYDHSTTEFKATGWTRLSYHTTGDSAGTWTLDDFTSAESGGWNYLKNIRSCTRDKLYYKGYEAWPDDSEYRASLGGNKVVWDTNLPANPVYSSTGLLLKISDLTPAYDDCNDMVITFSNNEGNQVFSVENGGILSVQGEGWHGFEFNIFCKIIVILESGNLLAQDGSIADYFPETGIYFYPASLAGGDEWTEFTIEW